jgi:ubiquinone/menaquinone biosynthesis C-methylase UbiE
MSQSNDDVQRAYDLASRKYAETFLNELDYKPRDRKLLARFAELNAAGDLVLDIGCGPGHTTNYLRKLGLKVTGIDLSDGMIEQATHEFPDCSFKQGDMLDLEIVNSTVDGILAFYCIVHLTAIQLTEAVTEFHRILKPGGVVLLSFHVGNEVVHTDDFLESGAKLDFFAFEADQVENALTEAGFTRLKAIVRDPYEQEYPSQRGYVWGFKPATFD